MRIAMDDKLSIEELYRIDPIKACRLALRRTAGRNWQDRLQAINGLLGTYGTEAIRGSWQNGFWGDIVATYCNTGDTYAVTVIHERGDWSGSPQGRFYVTSIGNLLESPYWCKKNGVE